jgi:chromosome segregation ATPase
MVTTRFMINSLQTAILPKKNKKNSKRKPGKRHRRRHFSIVRANGQVFKRNIQESVASENNNLRQQLEDVQDFAVFQQLSAETSIQQLQQQNQTLEEQIRSFQQQLEESYVEQARLQKEAWTQQIKIHELSQGPSQLPPDPRIGELENLKQQNENLRALMRRLQETKDRIQIENRQLKEEKMEVEDLCDQLKGIIKEHNLPLEEYYEERSQMECVD